MSDAAVPGMTCEELAEVAERFATPAYVFDLGAFASRLRQVRELAGEGVRLCYSIKANPFLARVAAEEGYMLEVCSPGELDICCHLGVDPAQVLYSGVCKGQVDTREAIAWGAGLLTAESPRQLDLVTTCAKEQGRVVPVLLRLSGGSQFGMSEEDLVSCLERRDGMGSVRLVGIHYFVGTQRRRLGHQRKELARLAALLDGLRDRCGWEAQELEYGPGLAHPYFQGEDFSDTLAPLRELAPALGQLAGKVALRVEMGRFLASPCGHYLTRVVDLKEAGGTSYAMVDGGIHHLTYLGQMMGMKVPVVRNLTAERSAVQPHCVCGSLCTTNDVLVRELGLGLEVGDVLSFENAGAYAVTEGLGLFLSRQLPAVVLRRGVGEWSLARDHQETWPLNTV